MKKLLILSLLLAIGSSWARDKIVLKEELVLLGVVGHSPYTENFNCNIKIDTDNNATMSVFREYYDGNYNFRRLYSASSIPFPVNIYVDNRSDSIDSYDEIWVNSIERFTGSDHEDDSSMFHYINLHIEAEKDDLFHHHGSLRLQSSWYKQGKRSLVDHIFGGDGKSWNGANDQCSIMIRCDREYHPQCDD